MQNADIFWLTLTILMTSLFWVPYIINRLIELSPLNALMYREVDPKPNASWANRMAHAHKNAVENIVIYAPLVLIIIHLGITSESTALAGMIYFFARAAHYIVYTLGIPFMRTITFSIAFCCQLFLSITILGAL
tara:strand:- start:6166 stop:6567 length:402 start_codon:yes stop_codon:yes gene_type:complete